PGTLSPIPSQERGSTTVLEWFVHSPLRPEGRDALVVARCRGGGRIGHRGEVVGPVRGGGVRSGGGGVEPLRSPRDRGPGLGRWWDLARWGASLPDDGAAGRGRLPGH